MARLKVFRIRKTKKQLNNRALHVVRARAPQAASAAPAGVQGPNAAAGARGGHTAYFPVGACAV